MLIYLFFFSSRRRHTRYWRDWSSDVCSSDLVVACRDVGDLQRAHEWTVALSRWCSRQPDLRLFRGECLVHRAEIMQLRGEWADALTEVEVACAEAEEDGDPVALGMARYQRSEEHTSELQSRQY